MYPLRFEPLFRRYIWGGRRLHDVLDKEIGNQTAAESWEIVDHQDDQSVVRFGKLAGRSLRQLIADFGADFLGESLMSRISAADLPDHLRNRFPLLLKFLDANRNLSVQVHPNDEFGSTLDPPDLGKTEAWYVMHAEPGAEIFAGLKSDVSQEAFRIAIEEGKTESTLHRFEAKQGDCIFIPAGTVHAIGAGLLIAEIQQASDTTFRVFDWRRTDQDGRPRPLHVDQAIQATNFEIGPVHVQRPVPLDDPNWMTMVRCQQFVMNRGRHKMPFQIGGDDRFRILAVTRGSFEMSGDPSRLPMKLGDTTLIPACHGSIEINPISESVELLEIYVPD